MNCMTSWTCGRDSHPWAFCTDVKCRPQCTSFGLTVKKPSVSKSARQKVHAFHHTAYMVLNILLCAFSQQAPGLFIVSRIFQMHPRVSLYLTADRNELGSLLSFSLKFFWGPGACVGI